MKREELKRLIKPLVKECITESLIEEGILSSVVSEVMKGMAPTQRSPESQASSPLGDVAPGDPGVDISGIIGLGGHKWKALM